MDGGEAVDLTTSWFETGSGSPMAGARYGPQAMLRYGERWKPYRTVAYLWRAADGVKRKVAALQNNG